MPRPSLSRCLPLLALLLAGCDRDEIRTYSVPKPTKAADKVRLVAAVFEDGKEQWYFKLLGPIDDVSQHGDAVDTLLRSVRFTKDANNPVTWTLPAGWVQKPGGGDFRHSTIHPDPKNKDLELSVSKLDRISPLLQNVNRWCDRDLGRKHLTQPELDEIKKEERGPQPFVWVVLNGPGPKKGGQPPMMMGKDGPRPKQPRPAPAVANKAITYAAPAGWKETGPHGGFVPVLTSFDLSEGAKPAKVDVIEMGGEDDLANVNRWRGQVGLAHLTAEQLRKDGPREVKVGGVPGRLYDLAGPKDAMLLAFVPRGGSSWYFKMMGNAEVVAKNRKAFDSFLQSVKFNGAANE